MRPGFSLVIPTLNEERRLPATLAAARAAFGDDAEYIVADGGSTDRTVDLAQAAGARVVASPRGRGEQIYQGCTSADREVCVLLHADTILPVTAAASIREALQDSRVFGGAFLLEFNDARGALRMLQGAINIRTRLFHRATGDQAMFARTAILREIGGVPRVPLFEDVRLCRALRRRGKFAILGDRVGTSARLWQEMGMTRGILLHLAFRTMHALGASPALLARLYPSPR